MDRGLRVDWEEDSETRMVDRIGSLIVGKYRVVRLIGSGSTGAVYACQHVDLDKLVALKILHREMETNASLVERFKREAQAASRLDHPNSVRVFDFGQDDSGALYIAMEYVEGRDLLQVLEEDGPFSTERAVDVMSQILDVLGVAHSLGIVHRDLKPENIIVRTVRTEDGEGERELVTVCDFGIAQFAPVRLSNSTPDANSLLSEVGVVAGTPAYMSPEQAKAEKQDARSDLYSAGVVLYQLVTLHLPFVADDPYTIAMKHCTELPPPPSRFGAVNPAIEEICLKALEKSREKRYQTAREMRGALLKALQSTTTIATAGASAEPASQLLRPHRSRVGLRWGAVRPATRPSSMPAPPLAAGELDAFAATSPLESAVNAKTAELPALAGVPPLKESRKRWSLFALVAGTAIAAGVFAQMSASKHSSAAAPHVVKPRAVAQAGEPVQLAASDHEQPAALVVEETSVNQSRDVSEPAAEAPSADETLPPEVVAAAAIAIPVATVPRDPSVKRAASEPPSGKAPPAAPAPAAKPSKAAAVAAAAPAAKSAPEAAPATKSAPVTAPAAKTAPVVAAAAPAAKSTPPAAPAAKAAPATAAAVPARAKAAETLAKNDAPAAPPATATGASAVSKADKSSVPALAEHTTISASEFIDVSDFDDESARSRKPQAAKQPPAARVVKQVASAPAVKAPPKPVVTAPSEPAVIDRANVSIGGINPRSAVSKASVRSALNVGAMTECYRSALKEGSAPLFALSAEMNVSTSSNGSVNEASLEAPALPASLRHCIEQVARRGRVREADTGEAQASITLAFSPR
jgi:serine/threonine-protein kinase